MRRPAVPIVIAFLVTRLVVLWLHAPEVEAGDPLQYVRVARSILDHGFGRYLDPGFTIQKGDYYPYFRGGPELPDGEYNPIFWDPLYPLFLALIFSVAGVDPGAVRAVQLALSLATLGLGMNVVARMFPGRPRAPEAFGWVFVAYLPLAGFVTRILAETLDAFLLTTILWTWVRLPRARAAAWLGFGALLGLYACIKSYWVQLVPVLLGLLLWLAWRGEGARPAAGRLALRGALLLVGFAAALAPTLVRNANIGGVALISTKAPWNFWKDNNGFRIENHAWREPGLRVHTWLKRYYAAGSAERVPATLPGVYYDERDTRIRPPCDEELPRLAACERSRALGFLFEDPLRFALRALEKNANLWSPNNYIFSRAPPGPMAWHQNFRVELPGALRWALQLQVIGLYVAVMLAFFVGITAPPESPEHRAGRAFLVLSLVYLSCVVVPWGHGVTRFRLSHMVPIAMFAVLGAARLRDDLPPLLRFEPGVRGRAALLAVLAAGFVAILLVKLPRLLAP